MAFLKMHFVFFACSFNIVTCNMQYGTPLPTQCDNNVLELAPILYIADGTNYSNCTIMGQPGTIIHGEIVTSDMKQTGFPGVTILAGTLVLEGVLLRAGILHIRGDDIAVRNSTIFTHYPWGADVFAVKGGRVNFEGVQLYQEGGSTCSVSLINTTAILSSTSVSPGWNFEVSNSSVSMLNSSVAVWDDHHMKLTGSIVNLTNSTLTVGHGYFTLSDSNATLSKSSIGVYMGTQGMSIGGSTVVADCDSSDMAAFWMGNGNYGQGMAISNSRFTFHKCSCDISRAIKIGGADWSGIRIDASSMHFEGCMSSASKEEHAILV